MRVTNVYADNNGYITGYWLIANGFQEMQAIVRGYCYQRGYSCFDRKGEELRSPRFEWPVIVESYRVYIDHEFGEVLVYEEIGSE